MIVVSMVDVICNIEKIPKIGIGVDGIKVLIVNLKLENNLLKERRKKESR